MDSGKLPIACTYTYNSMGLVSRTGDDGRTIPTDDPVQPQPFAPLFTFEHDLAKGLFVVTGQNGAVAVFRDKPTRYLAVAPNPKTGEMEPVLKYGEPWYVWLCREEREIR